MYTLANFRGVGDKCTRDTKNLDFFEDVPEFSDKWEEKHRTIEGCIRRLHKQHDNRLHCHVAGHYHVGRGEETVDRISFRDLGNPSFDSIGSSLIS